MVFQSEREPGNPFYQIYELDLTTGDTKRFSPGKGKTTCAFFQGHTGNVLFASTHHDPDAEKQQKAELDLRAAGKERRYAWDYDAQMELYLYRASSGALERLTEALGYDAEASFSPDGNWIVFSSMRDAYNRKLDSKEKKILETNPAYFAEIYIMRADGSGATRITRTPGYDGGPFFFPDGERIIFRRFDEEGLIADVYSMKPDGTDVRRITEFSSMSWAPYVHPSGEYLLFASNKLGFENFEIYLVDVAEKEPVRVTSTDGFDGLPVPSPDGEQLSWTSNRGSGGGGRIYLAQWSHEKAVEALKAAPLRTTTERKTP